MQKGLITSKVQTNLHCDTLGFQELKKGLRHITEGRFEIYTVYSEVAKRGLSFCN